MKVGFIGLGVMGAPMAANILKGGHELTVYDRSAEAVARLVQAGAKAAANPREVARPARSWSPCCPSHSMSSRWCWARTA